MEKYRTAGRLIILSVVTSLQELERQRHLQFALQFLFAVLHGQQPRPLFRAQVPLHGQDVSDTYSLRYNSYLLFCMDNNPDHSFEPKFLSTGRKLQMTLGPIYQGWQTSIKKIDES